MRRRAALPWGHSLGISRAPPPRSSTTTPSSFGKPAAQASMPPGFTHWYQEWRARPHTSCKVLGERCFRQPADDGYVYNMYLRGAFGAV